ncbi:MAG: alpha/beta hydrolase [Ferruginibacter sp.]
MTHYFIIPGLGNSGPLHWQTWFEEKLPNCTRINQEEWDAPDCQNWLSQINAALEGYNPKNIVLIGHSLGCATIAHWARQSGQQVKGALLVAPSDIEAPVYTFPATGFTPVPLEKIHFPTIVVASSNDEWVTVERAAFFAACWGSKLVNIGEAGHINAASGYYAWQQGLDLLQEFEK